MSKYWWMGDKIDSRLTPIPIFTSDRLFSKFQDLAGLYLPNKPVDHQVMFHENMFFTRPGTEPWVIDRAEDDLFKTRMRFSHIIPEYRPILTGIMGDFTITEKIHIRLRAKFGNKFMWKFWKRFHYLSKKTKGRHYKQRLRLDKKLCQMLTVIYREMNDKEQAEFEKLFNLKYRAKDYFNLDEPM